MKLKTGVGSRRPRKRSKADKIPRKSKMAMNREVTRTAFENREIVQSAPDKSVVRAERQAKLTKIHGDMTTIFNSKRGL